MIMQGVVQATEFTKKGAQKFQISGQWYYAGRCKVDGLAVGSEIEFNFNEFGEDQGRGRLKGLDWWKPITRGQSNGSQYSQQANMRQGGRPAENARDRVSQAITITEVDVLRSVSNIVGSACAAGSIKTPEELLKWCVAAHSGLTNMVGVPKPPAKTDPYAEYVGGGVSRARMTISTILWSSEWAIPRTKWAVLWRFSPRRMRSSPIPA
jgi:hypothetical protein